MELSILMQQHGPAIKRLCRSYEAQTEKANELNQDIWTAIWLSLSAFEERCSIRTWIFRIAHNTAANHVAKEMRAKGLISLEDLEEQIVDERATSFEQKDLIRRVESVLLTMKVIDRQVFWLYIEGHSQAEISEVTGLSHTHISTKVSRIKKVLETWISGEIP